VLSLDGTAKQGRYYYTVEVTDPLGCVLRAAPTLVEYYDCSQIPNIFTPNGDGTNDAFGSVSPIAGLPYDLSVYDRWGGQVYDTREGVPWDGSIKGRPAPPDVYIYLLVLHFQDGAEQVFKGDVTLVR
jgi:large repetitive protein